MGQKINAKAFRIGPVYTWNSRWFAKGDRYKKLVLEDAKIRKALGKELENAGVTKIEIERSINRVRIIIHTAKPGMVIGRGGGRLEELKKTVLGILPEEEKKKESQLELKVEPVKKPQLNAKYVAENIAYQLERRVHRKRAVYRAMDQAMEAGAEGIRIVLSGRIAGTEIARTEKYQKGKVPLSTIRKEIDFAKAPALTRSGYIGVKVWICQ